MVTVEDFSRLVSGIYAAAVTPQHWEPVIRDIIGTLDATGGGLVIADGSRRWLVGAIVPPEAAKSYAEHYCAYRPCACRCGEGSSRCSTHRVS